MIRPGSLKVAAYYLVIRSKTRTWKPHFSKTSATLQLHSMRLDGLTTTVVYRVMTFKLLMPFKHISRRSYLALRVGLNYLMKHGIPQLIVIHTVDPYVVWLRPYMDIRMLEPCGSNIVTPQYRKSVSNRSGTNGHHCISILKMMARARESPARLRPAVQRASLHRWTGMLAVAAQRALAYSLLELPLAAADECDGTEPPLGDLLADARDTEPVPASRLPAPC